MLSELANGFPVVRVGIPVLRSDNDDLEGWVVASARRKHGCCKPIALRIAQGQKHRHGSLHVSRKTNVLLNEAAGGRAVRRGCRLPGLAKMLLDGVAHDLRFAGGFPLGLDPEPACLPRGVADELHAVSTRKSTNWLRSRPVPGSGNSPRGTIPTFYQLALPRWSYLRSRPVSFLPSPIKRLAFSRSLFFLALLRCFSLPLPIICLPGSPQH